MPSPLTLAKLSLREEARDHAAIVDAQYDLAILAIQGNDTAAAAAHMANLARAARQCASALQALSENERVPA